MYVPELCKYQLSINSALAAQRRQTETYIGEGHMETKKEITCWCIHCKKITGFLDFFDQTFQGLELGQLFPDRESLVSDIPACNGKLLDLYLQCIQEGLDSG